MVGVNAIYIHTGIRCQPVMLCQVGSDGGGSALAAETNRQTNGWIDYSQWHIRPHWQPTPDPRHSQNELCFTKTRTLLGPLNDMVRRRRRMRLSVLRAAIAIARSRSKSVEWNDSLYCLRFGLDDGHDESTMSLPITWLVILASSVARRPVFPRPPFLVVWRHGLQVRQLQLFVQSQCVVVRWPRSVLTHEQKSRNTSDFWQCGQ